jgi:hypothetical protein
MQGDHFVIQVGIELGMGDACCVGGWLVQQISEQAPLKVVWISLAGLAEHRRVVFEHGRHIHDFKSVYTCTYHVDRLRRV